MGEVHVTIIGDLDVFGELMDAVHRCVREYNRSAGTSHTVGQVVIQKGIGGVDRFAPPEILLSTAQVGDPKCPQLTFQPIAVVMRHVSGEMHRRIFLIDEISDPTHREGVIQFFHMAGLSEQLYFCHSLEQDDVDNYRLAVFVHLLTLLDHLTDQEEAETEGG